MAFQLSYPEMHGIGCYLGSKHEAHVRVHAILSEGAAHSAEAQNNVFWKVAMKELRTKRPITEAQANAIVATAAAAAAAVAGDGTAAPKRKSSSSRGGGGSRSVRSTSTSSETEQQGRGAVVEKAARTVA